ncbi:DNA-binding protein RFX5 isoform X2 [Carcharodon carcharias]|uniref:DNA-binding protein RFX5 isoform X2 n=1 Tax=Carcharodon carcharias TaxID=13397 RepID=UPI001B7E0EC4|nr:DNA-binding protein RFX5 isoform X2 [Carcharodon carcharias]
MRLDLMEEEEPQPQIPNRSSLSAADTEGVDGEPSTLLHKIKGTVTKNVQLKVDNVLQEVKGFSDAEKLYLYLQLPSGRSHGDKSSGITSGDQFSSSTADQMHACNWIRNHLEEHPDTCLPKQDVYDAYKRYCDNLSYRLLSAANFGKIMRDVFPNFKARRLGGRGQSKYCYGGIRRKTVVNMPSLPSLDLQLPDPVDAKEGDKSHQDEVLMSAAISLICEWAQRVLMRQFDTVVDLARFLVKEHLISPRTKNAAVVMEELMTDNMLKSQKDPKLQQQPKNAGQESEEKPLDAQPKQTEAPKVTAANPQGGKDVRPGGNRGKQTTAADVDNVINRYPPIWPKAQTKKLLAISTAPCIAPSALPVRMGTPVPLALPPGSNSAGVIAAGPLPLLKKVTVILPGSVRLQGPDGGGPAPAKGQEPAGGARADRTKGSHHPKGPAAGPSPHKRLAGSPGEKQAPKRKRGRPRKVVVGQRPREDPAGAAEAATGGRAAEAEEGPAVRAPLTAEVTTPSPRLSPATAPPANAAAAVSSPPPSPPALPSSTGICGKPAAPGDPPPRLPALGSAPAPPRKNSGPSEPGARKTSVIRPIWWTGAPGNRRTRSPTHKAPTDHQ